MYRKPFMIDLGNGGKKSTPQDWNESPDIFSPFECYTCHSSEAFSYSPTIDGKISVDTGSPKTP